MLERPIEEHSHSATPLNSLRQTHMISSWRDLMLSFFHLSLVHRFLFFPFPCAMLLYYHLVFTEPLMIIHLYDSKTGLDGS